MTAFPEKPELLAPAGSYEAFAGALHAGADAVYLAGQRFGARAYAANFSQEELLQVIREAHILGRKVYLTANILTRESEMQELLAFVEPLYLCGLDGVIVQDTGVMAAFHRSFPGLPLHASTQMSVTSAEAFRELRRLGVCRVVPARELSLEEIRTIRREDTEKIGEGESPMEIEAFIHGAMCYSYSGRCLMSGFLGGRSGNRGRCAGTCRLPGRILDAQKKPTGPDARKKEYYPLSMKDMCVLPILPELIDAGIHSFKIEGRMKKPVYAAGVTAIYRKYIDKCLNWMAAGRPGSWTVEEEDLDALHKLYIRTGLGTGYYHIRNDRSLVTIGKPGYGGTDTQLEEFIREKYLKKLPHRTIDGRAVFRAGQPASLQVCAMTESGPVEVHVSGTEVQKATGRPMDPDDLAARLRRTGDSLFQFEKLTVDVRGEIFLPVSAVNALRRDALRTLADEICGKYERYMPEGKAEDPAAFVKAAQEEVPAVWAMVSTREQMEAAALAGCRTIIADGPLIGGTVPNCDISTDNSHNDNIPAVQSSGIKYIFALPPVFRIPEREKIRRMIGQAGAAPWQGILVRTPEELGMALDLKYAGEIIADASLYSWNRLSMQNLRRNCGRIICSLELNRSGIREAAGDTVADLILPVYGRAPMMETAGCVRKTEKQCRRGEDFWYLQDRRGRLLPVRCRCETCSNTIYNAVPLSLHAFAGRGLYDDIPAHLCMFTTESGEETRQILEFFSGLRAAGRKKEAGGRAASGKPPYTDYTTGHFRNACE